MEKIGIAVNTAPARSPQRYGENPIFLCKKETAIAQSSVTAGKRTFPQYMSFQENIVHTSDSPETAAIELTRFFKPEEIFDYKQATFDYLYANDEY